MCRAVCVVGLLALCVGMAHSWEFAVSLGDKLVFYKNDTKLLTIDLTSQNVTSLVFDDIHQTILYIDKQNNNDAICGYSLLNKNYTCFIKRNGRNIHGLALDPVTETIFFTDKNERSINFIPLEPGPDDNLYGNLLFELDAQRIPTDIVADSCHGYIYWITVRYSQIWEISRCRFNGTEREAFPKKYFEIFSLAIDLQIQQILYFGYYLDNNIRMVSSGYKTKDEIRGIHNKILLKNYSENRALTKVLTVSKDYIYFTNSSQNRDTVWHMQKNVSFAEPKEIIHFYVEIIFGIVANYKLVDEINGVQDCGSLSNLLSTNTEAPGNATERSTACETYCQRGKCSFNDDGLPSCSCDAGYTGERCQIAVHYDNCSNNGNYILNEKNEPTCQCKGGYVGDRCEVSPCLNYCLQGSCTVNDDGFPECSCNVGYSGDRCEVNVCQGYCLNNGDCSLNEENEPVCQCDGNHDGSRCEADINTTIPKYDAAKRNQTLAYLQSIFGKSSSKMYLTVEI
ncbi:hypothetical protein PYW08_008403 [Mythimna loreyi]|uniref:Uncharacterized protein n=1 Tax=Mythimna loreyi TaxID=667449 RepID=A0ACC2QBW9_9NEOP|nr:hypothetical protein PYW08_008403 [Mythimna loreyi]